MQLYETLCKLCKHRRQDTHPPTCEAFPQRIPIEIRLMWVDHRQAYKGDHGITFEANDDSEETRARLAKVKVRKPQRSEDNDLGRRVATVENRLCYSNDRQKAAFLRAVSQANSFEDLAPSFQQLLLAAEATCLENRTVAGLSEERVQPG